MKHDAVPESRLLTLLFDLGLTLQKLAEMMSTPPVSGSSFPHASMACTSSRHSLPTAPVSTTMSNCVAQNPLSEPPFPSSTLHPTQRPSSVLPSTSVVPQRRVPPSQFPASFSLPASDVVGATVLAPGHSNTPHCPAVSLTHGSVQLVPHSVTSNFPGPSNSQSLPTLLNPRSSLEHNMPPNRLPNATAPSVYYSSTVGSTTGSRRLPDIFPHTVHDQASPYSVAFAPADAPARTVASGPFA